MYITLFVTIFLLAGFVRLKYTKNYGFSYTFFVFSLTLGFFHTSSFNSSTKESYFAHSDSNLFIIEIIEPPVTKPKSVKLVAKVLQNKTGVTTGKALLYLEKEPQSTSLRYGDQLIVNFLPLPVKSNGNPYEFNYKRYLKIHNIHHQAYIQKQQWQKFKSKNGLLSVIYELRQYLSNLIDNSGLRKNNKKIAKALLLGQKEALDKSLLKSFSSAGAMHVLAVSGLHVGIIMFILQFLFRPFKHLKKGRFYAGLVISGIWFYALLTGFSPSVVRASIMFSFIIIGSHIERDTSTFQSVFVAGFVILLIDPLNLFKVGFQLSFLAVIGIITLQPKLYKLLFFKWKINDYLWKITTVSIAAQLATFPLGLYYFHQFPNLFFISNLLVIPMAGILLITGFTYFFLHFFTSLKLFIEYILDSLLTILDQSVKFIETIPFSISWGISITWYETVLIYLIIVFFSLSTIRKQVAQLFIALGITIALLTHLNIKKTVIDQSNELIVYNIKGHFALDIFTGRNNLFLAEHTLLKDEEKLRFHILHNWYHKKGNSPPDRHIDYSTKSNIVFKLNHARFLILNKTESKLPITDFVILDQIRFINNDIILEWIKRNTILIIHPNLNWRLKSYLKQRIQPANIYDISENGAFIYPF